MFTINISKDGWDIFNIIITVILTVCSLVLIYKCSSIEAEKKRVQKEEKAALDYLLIAIRRFLSYMLSIKGAIRSKINYINQFLEDPTNTEKRKYAFCLLYLIPNFQLDLAKYDFTVSTQPSIVDDIILYQEIYQDICAGVDRVNYISSQSININEPIEITIRTAEELITRGRELDTLEILASEIIVFLNRIYESILRCKKVHNYTDSFDRTMDDNIIEEVQKSIGILIETKQTRWLHQLNDIEPKKKSFWFWNKKNK